MSLARTSYQGSRFFSLFMHAVSRAFVQLTGWYGVRQRGYLQDFTYKNPRIAGFYGPFSYSSFQKTNLCHTAGLSPRIYIYPNKLIFFVNIARAKGYPISSNKPHM